MISLELQFFIVSLLWGFILLLAYDGLRIIRTFISHSAFLVSIEDIVFWSVSGVLVFIMIYEQNNGRIRGFSIVAMIIGMVLYHYLVSVYLMRFITFVMQTIFGMIGNIIKWIFRPFRIGLHFGNKVTKKIGKSLLKQLKKIAKTVKITLTRK